MCLIARVFIPVSRQEVRDCAQERAAALQGSATNGPAS